MPPALPRGECLSERDNLSLPTMKIVQLVDGAVSLRCAFVTTASCRDSIVIKAARKTLVATSFRGATFHISGPSRPIEIPSSLADVNAKARFAIVPTAD